jgi:hypothetical protein
MAKQEMPWVADQAFVTTGAQYFRSKELTAALKRVVEERRPDPMRIELGQEMAHTQIAVVPAKVANLQVYAGPAEGGRYVMGADPAYGSSEWADAFCISVWRVWFERIEQVAEFLVGDYAPYGFAWVLVYLCAMYAPCAWNLEVTGPGAAVLGEIDNLRRARYAGDSKGRKLMENFLGGMTEFLYTRFDSISRNPIARGTATTLKEKNRYMDLYRDYFSRGFAIVHSKALLEEMRWITREPGCAPSGSHRHKDDRVIAAALAVQMWHDKLRGRLAAGHVSWQEEQRAAKTGRVVSFYDRFAERQRQLLGLVGPAVPRR